MGQKNWTKEADLTFQAEAYFEGIDAYKKSILPREKSNLKKLESSLKSGSAIENYSKPIKHRLVR